MTSFIQSVRCCTASLVFLFLFSAVCSAQITAARDPDVVYLRNNPNRIENIPRIFSVMHRYGVTDVNNDGAIDCIDYSVTFRDLYGVNAKLMINKNPYSGFHHMFVRIWYDGDKIIDLEPQGTATRYTMQQIWGERYNWYYNTDATVRWSQFKSGF